MDGKYDIHLKEEPKVIGIANMVGTVDTAKRHPRCKNTSKLKIYLHIIKIMQKRTLKKKKKKKKKQNEKSRRSQVKENKEKKKKSDHKTPGN